MIMSQLIKRSIGQLKCQAVGHEVSEEEENRLYIKPTNTEGIREMDSVCSRCGAKVHLKVDPTNEDEYSVDEI